MISMWNEYRTDEPKESVDVPDPEEFKKYFPF